MKRIGIDDMQSCLSLFSIDSWTRELSIHSANFRNRVDDVELKTFILFAVVYW